MTKITVRKTRVFKALEKPNDVIVGFTIDGHTGFAASGEDIVCASLSLLATTTVNALNMVAGIKEKDIKFDIDEERGYLSLDTRNSINDKSIVIYNTFLIGVQLLVESYGDYITLITEEV